MVNDELVNVHLDRVQAGWEETSGPYHVEACGSLWDLQGSVPHGLLRPPGHTAHQLRPRQLSTSTLWESLDAQRDEHLLDSEGECVHWLVGNIPGGGCDGRRGPVNIWPRSLPRLLALTALSTSCSDRKEPSTSMKTSDHHHGD
ncbi:39S ribosomal protein L38, mitochondrial isoform X2 [Oncorhynchus mykiss]|uniref:39S ribosomal protein L38, mitochondrial isoform X2 n=1 Tax=Oncorhynchus mykiss TaxID=8022 RepID=UPI000B4F52A7|nr:39S ribosomal protein L38, mitochondrial isoform X2 [Oncorhynchus mykiss]